MLSGGFRNHLKQLTYLVTQHESSKPLFTLDFNRSIHIEADTDQHTTSDAGAFLIRSVLDQTKILDFLITGLEDPRDQNRIKHTLYNCFCSLS